VSAVPTDVEAPSPAEIREARRRLGDRVVTTPVWRWRTDALEARVGADTEVWLKLELFQRSGSFKPRGALTVMMQLEPDVLARGVTAVSAGNHAIAVAYAARMLGTTAKVVMMKTANPARVARCRAYGGEVVLVDDVHVAFEKVHEIEASEGRTFVHPFEGPLTALGTATLGLELCEQIADLDAVIVPIGGGGLAAGVAAAVKQLQPLCAVYGVEPEGADSMMRSFRAGSPQSIEKVRTVADSLGAPYATPRSFALCRRFLDDLVLVSDDAICESLALLFSEMKLAVEPAGAAACAAMLGPLRDRIRGKRVALIVCGANIDGKSYGELLARGLAAG
jgi:threonine dehydratase